MPAPNKTKIVCTIGPASRSPEILEKLLTAGMNIARLNFSHGEFEQHKKDIEQIKTVATRLGKPVAIMADLPGPKIRIGDLAEEEIELLTNQDLILTTKTVIGTTEKISVNLPNLHEVVQAGSYIFLNDGFIQLKVKAIKDRDIHCLVVVGGPLRSRKGLNVPDVDLGIDILTDKDKEIAAFALKNGVDALSLSFVEKGEDIAQLRQVATCLGYDPFIIAKIERSQAIKNLDDILKQADGIMVARGDLGVEIPIARIPIVQKMIVQKANLMGKPVITATHMLESMIHNVIPTRAEATDVANAILDGTDCVMLSGESAVGKHPVVSVTTLSDIAVEAENLRSTKKSDTATITSPTICSLDIIASSVEASVYRLSPAAVFVPTRSGATARNIARYHLPVWVVGVSSKEKSYKDMVFSYGVIPVHEPDHPTNWRKWIEAKLKEYGFNGNWVILTEGPSSKYPDRNDRMELIDLKRK
ncbi:pyruvate kinase [Desulfogranum japonicum]|uniref:pyruvate kinase n=1 Tax=Desulfogranum japonicum TaxID=231447 RepID=UPI000428A1E6|nr:pyruvate kinase [Desulfogranum japonicum]